MTRTGAVSRIEEEQRRMPPRFDHLSTDYEQLLRDPARDGFTGGSSEFFHIRKRDLIRAHFRRFRQDMSSLRYLDVGCGKGELLRLLRPDFREVAGCDLSGKMLDSVGQGIATRLQHDPLRIPFETESFDFITAVCVYHHVPPAERVGLTREIVRVLCPGGTFCIIEHNPFNPVTRRIVSRTPVDVDAILLRSREADQIMQAAGVMPQDLRYFLYLPAVLYKAVGGLEDIIAHFPFGGQYAIFGEKP